MTYIGDNTSRYHIDVTKKVQVSSYIEHYPILRIVQIALHFSPCETSSIEHRLGVFASIAMILMREDHSSTNIHYSL